MKTTDILIVTNDEIHAYGYSAILSGRNYASIQTHSEELAKRIAAEMKPDAAIIDTTLEKEYDGIDAAAALQKIWPCPVILIADYVDSALIEKCKRPYIYGLLVNPKADELRLAIDNALQRSEKEKRQKIETAQLQAELDTLRRQYDKKRRRNSAPADFGNGYRYCDRDCATYYHGKKLPLTVQENALLRFLASNAGFTVTLDDIANYIWDEDEEVTDNTVRTLVWRLRKNMPTDIIKSVSGIGYRI